MAPRFSQTNDETQGVSVDQSVFTPSRVIIGLILLHVALLAVSVFVRFVDADEGFYLSAAQQVGQGKLLYIDFFFPQMPFLPAVQSLIAGHGYATLYLGRLLGLIPAILALLLLVRVSAAMTNNRKALAVAVGLYALSGLIVAWHTTAKTYAWTDLFLLVTFWSLVQFRQKGRARWLVGSAVALALAVNFRLTLAAAIVPYGYLLWRSRSLIRFSALLAALGAVLVISSPTLYLFLLSPDRFKFDTFGFHLIRDPSLSFWGAIYQRCAVLGKLALNPQLWAVVGLLAVTVQRLRARGPLRSALSGYLDSPAGMAACFALVIFLVYVTPAPIHQQYFEQTISFAILAALPGIEQLTSGQRVLGRWKKEGILRWAAGVYALTLVVYLVVYLGAVRAVNRNYAMPQIRDMCRYIENSPEVGPVFSEWAGIAEWSDRQSVTGLEFVGFDYPLPIADSLKRYYRLPVNDDLKQVLRERQAAVYVVWNAPDTPLQAVADSNYVIAKQFGIFSVYTRKGR